MRGISARERRYVRDFVDIPEFRHNKVPLTQVTKDASGFHLTSMIPGPHFFTATTLRPTSGGNTMNAFLARWCLRSHRPRYSVQDHPPGRPLIHRAERHRPARPQRHKHRPGPHTYLGPTRVLQRCLWRTYLLVSPHPPIDTLDMEIKSRFKTANDIPILTPATQQLSRSANHHPHRDRLRDHQAPNREQRCHRVLERRRTHRKAGTDVCPDESCDEVLCNITERFTKNHNPNMDPSMTFAMGFSRGGSLTCYQYKNEQFLIHLPLDEADSLCIATEFGDPKVDPAYDGRYGVGRGDARIIGHLFYPYFIEALKDGLKAAVAASELDCAIRAYTTQSTPTSTLSICTNSTS